MSGLKPTATPFQPSKSWADDDGEDDGDISKDFAALSPKKGESTSTSGEASKGMSSIYYAVIYTLFPLLPFTIKFNQSPAHGPTITGPTCLYSHALFSLLSPLLYN
jgi:hypothetical protein